MPKLPFLRRMTKKETISRKGTSGRGNEADPPRSNLCASACVSLMKCAAPSVMGDGPLPMEGQMRVTVGSQQCGGSLPPPIDPS